ncbi:MAG TPA: efflux RND transporter periplasmic adaptor subunit [Caulobacteraceae bacterium]|nr:efflux RND transporter periplasmic adaptor subunit [Caulobacteraceae bacterium]
MNPLKIPPSHLFAAVAAVTAVGLTGCGASRPKGPPMGPAVVQVFTVQTRPVTLTTELPGRTNALEVADVRPQVNGIIKARLFTEGAVVHAGQVLYQIDPAPYQAAYDQAKAQLASAQALVVTARFKTERYAELAKIKAVSQQDADDAEAAYRQDAAAVLQQQAALETARINLGYTRIIAPITGRIGTSAITKGALAVNGQTTALSTVQRLDPIYVDLTQSATEHLRLAEDLARIGPAGGPPRGAVVRAQLVDGRPYPLEGRLLFSDVTVDQSTGSVTLRARFPNPNSVLLPGMYVRATVVEGVDPKGILVPQSAVARDEKGRPTVLIVDSAGKAQLRLLQIAGALGPNWRVISGLSAGDRVIASGGQDAKPGAPVRIAATVPGPG